MKKFALLAVAASFVATSATPAIANRAPAWSTTDYFGATLYGTEWDGSTPNSGTITGADVDLDINQSGSPTIRIINIDLGSTVNLSSYGTVTVAGDDGDYCDTGSQAVSISGDEISIKGINCYNNNGDGDTEVNVDVRDASGTISSYFFNDHKIEGTFRYYDSRRNKSDSYRMAYDYGVDFVSDED